MDVWLDWHDDFIVTATGDLMLVDGDDETRQRLERRLFTAVKGYVWHPDYGAGLPQKIGDPWTRADIETICRAQVYLEDSVAPNPPAKVTVLQDRNQPSNIGIGIQYWDKATGVSVQFVISD
jgi:hypothetical protein